MPDREKVIRLIEEEIRVCESVNQGYRTIDLPALRDILALLKEQKPLKPIYSEEKFGDFLPHCPVCKKVLPSVSQYGKSNFCYNCKQAVKWDD